MDGDICALDRVRLSSSTRLSSHDVARISSSSFRRRPHLMDTLTHKCIMFVTAVVCVTCLISGALVSITISVSLLVSFFGGVFLVHGLYGSRFQMFLQSIQYKKCVSGRETKRSAEMSAHSLSLDEANFRSAKYNFEIASEQLFDNVLVSAEVDNALEQLLQLTFEEYIISWHQDVTDEGSFINELKHSVRCMVVSLVKRLQQVDLSKLITRKLIRAGMLHLDSCLQAINSKAYDGSNLEEAVFEYYGKDLHVAVLNRRSELDYLHSLCGKLLPYLLSPRQLQCRPFTFLIRELFGSVILLSVMDSIADSYIVNSLLSIFFDKTPMIHFPPSPPPTVPLLKSFVTISPERCRTKLGTEVSNRTCLSSEAPHLYPFMQYLKKEGLLGLLQFCLAVDEFNVQLLNPDLSDADLHSLHQDAQKLYDVYMSPNGVDCLNFSCEIVSEFESIVRGSYAGVVKLQTSEPLYKAYDYAFGLLERQIPLFCRSEVYFECVCGKLLKDGSGKAMNKPMPRKGLSAAAKLGNKINKIRGALITSAIDGRIEDDLSSDIADAGFEAEEMKLDVDSSYNDIDDFGIRDLNAWRISIPCVKTHKDEYGKSSFAFVIDVQRIDITNKDNPDQFHWIVERRYDEFYVLESKLIEFHGGFMDIHLPMKRSFGNKGLDFLESRIAAFEEFLQRLLQKSTFRGSELLFTFLSSTGDFTKGLLPDINLGRMFKNVPMKLVKERGQHLDSFMQNFIASTDAQKPKQCKIEYKDVSCHPLSSITENEQKSLMSTKTVKGNRANSTTLRSNSVLPQTNLCDYLVYVWLKVIQMPCWTLHLVLAFVKCFGICFEAFVERYLEVKLQQALVPQRIAILIHLLKDVIYPKDAIKPIEESDIIAEHDDALRKAKQYLPLLLVKVVGRERHDAGFDKVFQLVQHPRLNKQLLYTLLDILVLELFPEFQRDYITPTSGNEVALSSGDQHTSKPENGIMATTVNQRYA